MKYDSNSRGKLAIEILTRALGAAVFAMVTFLWSKLSAPNSKSPIITFLQTKVSTPLWAYILSYIGFAVLISFLFFKSRVRTKRGREVSMAHNVELLQERVNASQERGLICSTRFASWPLAEASPYRTAFRREIDNAVVKEGRSMRRIWNISSLDDCRRLQEILERYKGNPNKSIRVLFDIPDYLLPEILIVNGEVASISFPQQRNPLSLEAALVVRDKEAVRTIQEYFDNLWNHSERALEAGRIVESTLLRVRERQSQIIPQSETSTPNRS
jgi:hypothetical protein